MANEKMLVIQKTHDHDMFSFIEGNRHVSKTRISALKKSIEKNNLLYLAPIVVNEKMKIIDGQHRWQAAKELNVPIYYMIVPDIDVDDMIILNAYQRAWTLDNFLKLYLSKGLPEYVKLQEFANKWSLSTSMATGILTGSFTHSTGIREDFKSGNFVATNAVKGEKLMEEAQSLQPFTQGGDFLFRREFLHAFSRVLEIIKIDELLLALQKGEKIERRATRIDYFREFELILNKGKKTNFIRLF